MANSRSSSVTSVRSDSDSMTNFTCRSCWGRELRSKEGPQGVEIDPCVFVGFPYGPGGVELESLGLSEISLAPKGTKMVPLVSMVI